MLPSLPHDCYWCSTQTTGSHSHDYGRYASVVRGFGRLVTLMFDLLNWKSAQPLLLPWETVTPIFVFSMLIRFSVRSRHGSDG